MFEGEALAALEAYKAETRRVCRLQTAPWIGMEEEHDEDLLNFVRTSYKPDAMTVEEVFPGQNITRIDQLPMPDATFPPPLPAELDGLLKLMTGILGVELPSDYVAVMQCTNGLILQQFPAEVEGEFLLSPVADMMKHFSSIRDSGPPEFGHVAARNYLLEREGRLHSPDKVQAVVLCGSCDNDLRFWYILDTIWTFWSEDRGFWQSYGTLKDYLVLTS